MDNSTSSGILPASLGFLRPVVQDLIRLGNESDGGYLLPAAQIPLIDATLSFGLARDWTFEAALLERNPNLLIHAYDHTIGIEEFQQLTDAARYKAWIGFVEFSLFRLTRREVAERLDAASKYRKLQRGYQAFFSGDKVRHYKQRLHNRQESGADATMDEAFARLGGKANVLVKMDIEGDEYRVLPDLLRHASLARVLVIEFHDIEPLRDVFTRHVQSLLQEFEIVHIHGNNCAGVAPDGLPDVLEITFVNRRFVRGGERRDRLPLPLDFPNEKARPDYPLVWG